MLAIRAILNDFGALIGVFACCLALDFIGDVTD